MRCSVALDNLSRTIPQIDSDQKVALLHEPFKGTTFFGCELAKLHRANKERASFVTVFPAASPQTYSTKPYTGHGRSFGRVAPSIEVTGIEVRVDLPPWPQPLNRPSLETSSHHDCYSTSRLKQA